MSRKRYAPEQIFNVLRQTKILISQGRKTGKVCCDLWVSEQSYCRWRKGCGGLRLD